MPTRAKSERVGEEGELRPWQLGPHGELSQVFLQSLLGLCGPLLTPQCHSSSVVPKSGCPYAKRGLSGLAEVPSPVPHITRQLCSYRIPCPSHKGRRRPRLQCPLRGGLLSLSSPRGPRQPFRGRGGSGAACCEPCRTRTQRRLSSPKVVPRQPHPRPSRAHADEGAAGRSLPGAQEERAQLLRHLLSVRPGTGCGEGAGAMGGLSLCFPSPGSCLRAVEPCSRGVGGCVTAQLAHC